MFRWIQQLLNPKHQFLEETDVMKKFLLIGLGNIGAEYANTRHNIGFQILDALAQEEDLTFETVKLGDLTTFNYKGKAALCLKPSTYMNLSGKAVRYWMEKENIPLQNILIITDDINLPFGTLRLKTKGSDGGHNGLKDVQNTLQTSNYNRFRFGVGADFSKGKQVDYVLGSWSEDENQQLTDRLKKSTELVRSFIFAGTKNTMNQFNNT